MVKQKVGGVGGMYSAVGKSLAANRREPYHEHLDGRATVAKPSTIVPR